MAVVYASFWIRPRTVEAELSSAIATFFHGGQSDPAKGFLDVLAADPGNSAATVFLADLDSRRGHNDRAAQRVEQALQRKPGDAYLEARGAQYVAAEGRLAEAMTWASNATWQAPDDFVAPEVWSTLALQAGQYGTAKRAARMALSVDPFPPATHVDLGRALLHLGQTNEAAEQFSLAAAGFPALPSAHFWLATALAGQPGKRAEARAEMEQAIRLDPENADWRAALQAMEKN
jgi:predicted Zn-dependent protease